MRRAREGGLIAAITIRWTRRRRFAGAAAEKSCSVVHFATGAPPPNLLIA